MNRLDREIWKESPLGIKGPVGFGSAWFAQDDRLAYSPLTTDDLSYSDNLIEAVNVSVVQGIDSIRCDESITCPIAELLERASPEASRVADVLGTYSEGDFAIAVKIERNPSRETTAFMIALTYDADPRLATILYFWISGSILGLDGASLKTMWFAIRHHLAMAGYVGIVAMIGNEAFRRLLVRPGSKRSSFLSLSQILTEPL